MLLTLAPSTFAAANDYSDVPQDHWAYTAIAAWSLSENGILGGYGNGKFGPSDNIKEKDLELILARILGGSEPAWENSTALTREQAAKTVAETFGLQPVTSPAVGFADDSDIGAAYKPYVYALKERGYVVGVGDNTFVPQKTFTRAEIVQIVYNAISGIIDTSVNDKTYAENIVVRSADVTVKSSTAKDIIVGQGVGDGDVTLDTVTATGQLLVYGGGKDSIHIINSTIPTVTIAKERGGVRVVADSKSKITTVIVNAGVVDDVIIVIPNATIIDNSTTAKVLDKNGNTIAEPGKTEKTNANGEKVVTSISSGSSGGSGGHAPPPQTTYTATSLSVTVSENEILTTTGTALSVYFYAELDGTASNVKLLASDKQTVLAELKDDGLYSTSGDDLSNDNIYSCILPVDTSAQQRLTYYVKGEGKTNLLSDSVNVDVITPLTNDELQGIDTVAETLETLRESQDYLDMSISDRSDAVLEELTDLVSQELIDEETIYYDEEASIITFMYSSGILGGERLVDFSPLVGGISTSQDRSVSNSIQNVQAYASSASQSILGNAKILYAWGDPTSDKWSSAYTKCQAFETDWSNRGFSVSLDSDVTISDMKSLKNENLVYVAAHGLYTTFKYNQQYWLFIETSSDKITAPGVYLLEKSTTSKDAQYADDLKKGRIVIVNGEYVVLPGFFDKHYKSGDLANTIMFWGSCEYMGKNNSVKYDWPDVLNKKSVKANIGFHNSNYIWYHYNLLDTFVGGLVDGSTVQDALNQATALHGTDDVIWYNSQDLGGDSDWWDKFLQWVGINETHPHSPAAYPILQGDGTAKLINTEFENGSFENGSSGWNTSGDVRILSQLSTVVPQHGSKMALLTTGIGSQESEYLEATEGSVLSQTFVIPSNGNTLSLKYDVISEEPMEFVGSEFDDKLLIQIVSSGSTTEIVREEVNTSTWLPISGIDFEGGDSTTFHTGWKTVTVDLSAYKGQSVTLKIVVYDVGDSIYDTAAVIDDVKVQ
jgi:hypothetical protein